MLSTIVDSMRTSAEAGPRLGGGPDCGPWMGWFRALTLVAALSVTATASAGPPSLLVMEAGTGRTLQAVGADTPRYPASLTKMMTLYLLFEALDQNKLKLGSRMRVSASAAAKPPTALGLNAGQTISVHNAILAITTESANDVAATIGETLSGSESRFAGRMTSRARSLGMRHTAFANASGLPHVSHRTTARDMATLARALLRDYPHYYHYFGARQFSYAGVTHLNHNRLLGLYPGLDGIKTGYTRAAGYNLVASAKRNGRRLIGVVMGSSSKNARARTMTRLLDRGFQGAPSVRQHIAAAAAPPAGKNRSAQKRSSDPAARSAKTSRLIASR